MSGGLDSTTALALAVDRDGAENVLALSLSYGQRHVKELGAARRVAGYYKVKHIEMDLAKVFQFDVNVSALLAGTNQALPEGGYRLDGVQPTYVPYRNGLFLSVAASVALQLGCSEIVYGAHRDDAAGNAYPDCSEEFAMAQNEAIIAGSGEKVQLFAPFIKMTKADIVKLGIELKVPYGLTWSCYAGGDKPCGVCGTCVDRAKAFALNGAYDPTIF